MSPEEMIKSDDIEVAQLGVNILLETYSVDDLLGLKLLRICKFIYVRDENSITLKGIFPDTSSSSSIFLKDPTRSVLIDIK